MDKEFDNTDLYELRKKTIHFAGKDIELEEMSGKRLKAYAAILQKIVVKDNPTQEELLESLGNQIDVGYDAAKLILRNAVDREAIEDKASQRHLLMFINDQNELNEVEKNLESRQEKSAK